MNIVIAAGGRVDGELAQAMGTTVKALARIGGESMLDRVIAAARDAGGRRIAVVGGNEVREAVGSRVERVIGESGDGTENVRRALCAWNDGSPLLFLTSDMPFLTGRALQSFVAGVPEGTLGMPLVEERDYAKRFPGSPEHGLKLRGEQVVNGGAFLIPGGAAQRLERLAVRFFDARKSRVAMARLLGPGLTIAFALHRLSVERLEREAHRILNVPARAVRNSAPELAFDVDTYEDYRYARAH